VANSTTNLDQLVQSQASKEVTANALWDAMSQAATYGRRASTTSGLTWGFYGGNVVVSSGAYVAVANGTLTLTASATNYIVALKADGVVSFATVSTNWDNVTDYWRLYRVVTGTATITSYTDDRQSSFLAVSGNGNGAAAVVIVPDGTERTITESQTYHAQASAEDNDWHALAWSQELGRCVAIARSGTNRVMYSDDGITWVPATASNNRDWRDVVWADTLGRFVAVAFDGAAAGQVMTSPDGVTWTDRTSSLATQWGGLAWARALGRLVAVAESGANRVMTSEDGITWTSRTAAAANTWRDVDWSAELALFCAVSSTGTANRVMTSPDGITWTSRSTSGNDNFWSGVVWGAYAGVFVAVAQSGTNRVLTSPDGITWTGRTAAAAQQWYKVTWAPEIGLFHAVHLDSVATSMTSRDGITWASRTAATANAKRRSVWCAGLGMFIVTASAGVGNRVETSAGYVGVYTPTLFAVANVAASTAFPMRWERRGKNVMVYGQVNIQATAGATNTQLGVSLPLSATFAAEDMLSGSATAGFATVAGSYVADTSNARAEFRYLSESTINRAMRGSFNYRLT